MKRRLTFGTRGSKLALWQTEYVKSELEKRAPDAEFEVRVIETTGDRVVDTAISKIGNPGLFATEIENALLAGEIDLAVHSLKDLPTEQPDGLTIAAVVVRELPNEVFISKEYSSIDELPAGAVVATGSLRRRSQLLNFRPDLRTIEIRGNVPTRIEKAYDREIDGLMLAFAGVHRLGLDEFIREIVPTETILPAAGQAAIAVEIREGDSHLAEFVKAIDAPAISACVKAERTFLHLLDGGCQAPVGALATIEGREIILSGFAGDLDGKEVVRGTLCGNAGEPEVVGRALAEIFEDKGAARILADARESLKTLNLEMI
jgi:hydroxymethylbilane synthase